MKFPSFSDYRNQIKAGLKPFFSGKLPLPAFFQYGQLFVRIEDAKNVEFVSFYDGGKAIRQALEPQANCLYTGYKWKDLEKKGFVEISQDEYLEARAKAEITQTKAA